MQPKTPTPPNYALIYWLEYERTADHKQAAAAVEKAMIEYEKKLTEVKNER